MEAVKELLGILGCWALELIAFAALTMLWAWVEGRRAEEVRIDDRAGQ